MPLRPSTFVPARSMMKLYAITEPKGIDSLTSTERPAPRPGPGEVLVRGRATSLNSRNLMMIKGGLAPMMHVRGVASRDGGQPGPSGHREGLPVRAGARGVRSFRKRRALRQGLYRD